MKFKKFTEKAAALSMATAMLASVCAPTYTAVLSAVPVAAASSKDTTNNTATTKQEASLSINMISHRQKQLEIIPKGNIKQPVNQITA